MNRIVLAIRVLFAVLFDAAKAEKLKSVLVGHSASGAEQSQSTQPVSRNCAIESPGYHEAIVLLAALQREARLVDLIKQPLADFSDEEIGAAARNVLADSAAVIDRFFSLQPLASQPEGSSCDVPAGYDPACYKLGGRVEGSGPFRGKLVHHGWKATAVELPTWTGSKDAAMVVAPAEVEVT